MVRQAREVQHRVARNAKRRVALHGECDDGVDRLRHAAQQRSAIELRPDEADMLGLEVVAQRRRRAAHASARRRLKTFERAKGEQRAVARPQSYDGERGHGSKNYATAHEGPLLTFWMNPRLKELRRSTPSDRRTDTCALAGAPRTRMPAASRSAAQDRDCIA